MTYQVRVERGRMKIYDTRKHLLYWLDDRTSIEKLVALLNEKSFQQGVQPTIEGGRDLPAESIDSVGSAPANSG
jgi:hypothetical protein